MTGSQPEILSFDSGDGEEEHWLSVSDLMAGLMIVFLFISVALMFEIQKPIAEYQDKRAEIYSALVEEFEDDKEEWNAELVEEKLAIYFHKEEVLFESGKDTLKPDFEALLEEFFPRYLNVMMMEDFEGSIDEIRIEGHTSEAWHGVKDKGEKYFRNMELSQDRAYSVLSFVHRLGALSDGQKHFIKKNVAAVGLSFRDPIINPQTGEEDPDRSRRVTFRTITNAESEIQKIHELLQAVE